MSATAPAPRRLVLPVVFALLFLPAALAIVGAVSFNLRNRNNGTLVSSGETREYLLHVPANLDRTKPTALVISMHGGALWPATHMETSHWNRVADREGFIVVYPSGRGLSRQKVWQAGQGASHSEDVTFISDLIDALRSEHNIDPARIYADGLSNGGGMAFLLSCALSHRIAAVGMVAPAVFLPWERCTGDRPVPMIAFHGTADRFTRYHGGPSRVARGHLFPDIQSWVAAWATRNRCGPQATESVVAADVTRTAYGQCEQGASVDLYSIHGGGHTWPGGAPLPEWFVGKTTRSIDASTLMWQFFQAHPMPIFVRAPIADEPPPSQLDLSSPPAKAGGLARDVRPRPRRPAAPYSARSATIGRTRVARFAGTNTENREMIVTRPNTAR